MWVRELVKEKRERVMNGIRVKENNKEELSFMRSDELRQDGDIEETGGSES